MELYRQVFWRYFYFFFNYSQVFFFVSFCRSHFLFTTTTAPGAWQSGMIQHLLGKCFKTLTGPVGNNEMMRESQKKGPRDMVSCLFPMSLSFADNDDRVTKPRPGDKRIMIEWWGEQWQHNKENNDGMTRRTMTAWWGEQWQNNDRTMRTDMEQWGEQQQGEQQWNNKNNEENNE